MDDIHNNSLKSASSSIHMINGVNFTPREIDILACILGGRTAKKMASFLSLSSRTIESYTRNIMFKVAGNSREHIIDFLEKSDKLSMIREHYSNILTLVEFEKILKEVSRLKWNKNLRYLLVYWENNDYTKSVVYQLSRHLNLVGLTVSVETRKKHGFPSLLIHKSEAADYVLYAASNSLIEEFLGAPNIEEMSFQEGILFLLLERENPKKVSEPLIRFDSVNIGEGKNYYFSFFEILRTLLPNVNFENNLTKFKEQYKVIQAANPHTYFQMETNPREEKSIPCQSHSLRLNRKNLFSIFLTLLFVIFLIIFVFVVYKNEQNNFSVHSNIMLPAKSTLLDRPELITQMDDKFKQQKGVQTLALVGMGGVGKTILARQYALSQNSSVTWEIAAETDESLMRSFEILAYAISKTKDEMRLLKALQDIRNVQEKKEKIISYVKERLKASPNWLLIYDNVEKFTGIQNYFPSDSNSWGKGKVIITTRDSHINHIKQALYIGELSHKDKVELFRKITYNNAENQLPIGQKEQEENFLNNIPSFPLDIVIAAHYLKATHIPFKAYLERLTQHEEDFSTLQENILKETSEYTKSRYRIITFSLKNLINTHKDFEKLLLLVSLVDSQHIPRDLLDSYGKKIIVDEFIFNLKKYSLITTQFSPEFQSGSEISIHRSLQKICLNYLTKILSTEQTSEFLLSISKVLENYTARTIENENISKMKIITNHCEKLMSHNTLLTNLNRGDLGIGLGCIYYYLGDYIKAKDLLEKSLATLKRHASENYERIAQGLVYLGMTYKELGNFKKSISLFEQSLIIYKKHFSENHVGVGQALGHLGNIYTHFGNSEKAKELLEQSLVAYKKHSKNHIGVARTLGYLGNVYRSLGDYKKAKELLEQSISIYKSYFPENDLGIAQVLVHLGNINLELGEYENARILLEQGLSIYTTELPNDQLGAAWASIHLGNVYRSLRNYKKAEELVEHAFSVYTKQLPEDHVGVVSAAVFLGNIYRNKKDYKKAKNILERNLIICRQHVPEDHVRIGRILRYLGNVYRGLEEYEKARTLLEQSRMVYEKNFGKDHIEVARILRDLGKVYLLAGQSEIAKANFKKSLIIFQKNKHPEGHILLENLLNLYR